ncbi:MAG TPA: AEC family transporter, partial [Methylococcales bacterium]
MPLVLLIAFGFGLKQAKFLTPEDGGSLLKLVFYAGSPALIFNSIMKANIDSSLLILCFLPAAIVGVTMAAVFLLRRSALKKVHSKTYGSLLAGAVIMNTLFLIPFVQQLYGAPGLALIAVVDTMNAMLIFSVIYATVVKIGHDTPDYRFVAKKLLIAPPLWALTIAILCKLNHIGVPETLNHTLVMVAALVSPVILIAMG